jgi:5-methylcytosine-specific restriction protein A
MFIVGVEYPRHLLLEYVGSKQAQAGILWGDKHPDCVVVTSGGRHSKEAGYEDKQYPDGSWVYFGQGGTGDQEPNRYSNRLLVDEERSVLLFTTREPSTEEVIGRNSHAKLYRFEGIFGVRGWEFFIPSQGLRKGNKLLLFHLIPNKNVLSNWEPDDIENEIENENNDSLLDLRNKLGTHNKPVSGILSPRGYKRASAQIKRYAKLRAMGVCENCNKLAPFIEKGGQPYLEVHHLFRLADDGPDSPENVAALCPNCHRMAHFGQNQDLFRDELVQLVREKEARLGND